MNEHLGTPKELCEFSLAMAIELEKHMTTKKPLRNVDYEITMDLINEKISTKIKEIEKLKNVLKNIQR